MFKSQLIKLLTQATSMSESEVSQLLVQPPDPNLGDYAFPCFKLGKNPKLAAEQLKAKLKLPPTLAEAEASGPYLNLFLNPELVAEVTLTEIKKQKNKYGRTENAKSDAEPDTNQKTIVIEYCGPNTNKPLHLGHIRNMSLGNAFCRLLAFQGNKVHPVNIINDRGIHICQSMLAYQKFGNNKKPDKKGDHFVGDYYVLYAQHAKTNENFESEAKELLLKWERGDKTTRALWKKMNSWVLNGFNETYKRFGISFKKEYFESQYYEHGKELVNEGLQKNIFTKDHTGAVTAPLQQFGLPDKILLRGDETSLYMTQDLYLAELRYKDFKFDHLMYVVASEQNLHFRQLFKILELLNKPYAKNLHHLSYGLVNLPSGRMKSREGTVVDADDLINEIVSLAEKEIRTRHKDLSDKETKARADLIGIGAIKFYMLRTDAVRDIIFNPEESISFEGETGPYLQYTHARACSILRKAGTHKSAVNYGLLSSQQEQKIIKLLMNFPTTINEAAKQVKLHLICRALLDIAQAFNEFYHSSPVISEDKELMKARLLLVDAVRQVLANGLGILGITPLEEM